LNRDSPASELAVFAAVVEAGSLAEAARSLGMTPSAVSKRLIQLEDRLGVRLANRTTRRLSLTEVGEEFHARCTEILSDIQAAEAAAAGRHSTPAGVLRVSCASLVGDRLLIPMLPDFAERYPDLRVDLTLSDRLSDIVEEGFDLALRIGEPKSSSLIGRVLLQGQRALCAAPEYLQRHGHPLSPDDLAGHRCLALTSPETTLNAWRFLSGGKKKEVGLRKPYRFNDGAALYRAALGGLGIARVATVIASKDFHEGRLVRLLRDHDPAEDAPLSVLYPSRQHVPAKLRAFIDFVAERVSSMA